MTTTLGPTDEQITTMRRSVLDGIPVATLEAERGAARARRQRRSPVYAAVVTAVVAAVVVGSIVLPRAGDEAQAATLLREAAALTVTASDPVVAPGQFLRTTTEAVYATVGQNRAGDMVTYLVPSTSTVYEPGDPAAEWTLVREDHEPTTFYGDDAEQVAEENRVESPETNGTWRARDGAFYGTPAADPATADLPRDPQELYDHLVASYDGGSNSRDEATWVAITDLLRTGTAPADLRSALYGAAALVPGIEIVDEHVTIDGVTGVALGREEPTRSERQDIVIDPSTGELIGERVVQLEAAYGAPAGTVTAQTSVTRTVVDRAP
ncbi:hypothetical protein ASF82_14055 [Frigoribacterium sp. Leaf164]|uniref:CU044_5270 family protein n=1 Tax=Frigoribacterium sp. Leaf164 TaxID=1736282 RepID=UPI0006F9A20C|nr:CU044_5270 family protein [Frigoribacterium sp. Leaf164]KQR44535.1 hypothetical protein ASF82_14055 [Frigoribacterium sp. Leaf164]